MIFTLFQLTLSLFILKITMLKTQAQQSLLIKQFNRKGNLF
ncbi:hypothetical protein GARC_4404 [Paraglaciecola arctica BSs20135]|uniref:Uncharacterized protein n=1 Tax=Paraglaciecola arctica BSs20135 TaxID=493475 RepID=K6YBP6_9ALTE|nr:hypothetical protein GARC_4404 [Paraglaciecola arctica BSs20135]